MKENKHIGIVTLLKIGALIGGIYLVYYFYKKTNPNIPTYETNYNICIKDYRKEYKGIIIKNWAGSRGSRFSKLSNGQIYYWYYNVNIIKSLRYKDSVEVWEFIEVGDSIHKPAGSFDTYIYKKGNPDSVIYLKCNYDCKTIIMYAEKVPRIKYKIKNDSVIFNWSFDKKYEKYLKQILLIKDDYSNKIDTFSLTPSSRNFIDTSMTMGCRYEYYLLFKYVNNKYRKGTKTFVKMY